MRKNLSFSSGLLILIAVLNYIWAATVVFGTAKRVSDLASAASDLGPEVQREATQSALGAGLLAAAIPVLIGTVAFVGYAIVSRMDDLARTRRA